MMNYYKYILPVLFFISAGFQVIRAQEVVTVYPNEYSKQIIWTEELPDIDITQWLPGDDFNYTTRVYDKPVPLIQVDASFTGYVKKECPNWCMIQ